MILFTIAFSIDHDKVFVIRRSIESLQLFLQELLETKPANESSLSNKFYSQILSILYEKNDPKTQFDKHIVKSLIEECLSNPVVVQSNDFLDYLWEDDFEFFKTSSGTSFSENHEIIDTSPFSAIDFILDPVLQLETYIPRLQTHFYDYKVQKDETLVWSLKVEDKLDIDFSILFESNEEHSNLDSVCEYLKSKKKIGIVQSQLANFPNIRIIHLTERISTFSLSKGTYTGTFTTSISGIFRFFFDNSYSYFNGKNLKYKVVSVTSNIMQVCFYLLKYL
jgi:hypothetical protein